MSVSNIFKLILLACLSCFVKASEHKQEDSSLFCRYCNRAVGDPSHIFNKLSPVAMKVENVNMFGKNVTVQTLVNPFLFKFDVITIDDAGCKDEGMSIGGRTWFPGYAWRICTCPRCSSQLGWTFEKELSNNIDDPIDVKKSFNVLMLRSLLGLSKDDDLALGMMHFLKHSKPYKGSTTASLKPRASDDIVNEKEGQDNPIQSSTMPVVVNSDTKPASEIVVQTGNTNRNNTVGYSGNSSDMGTSVASEITTTETSKIKQ